MEVLTEGWVDWQAALPALDMGAVVVALVAGFHHNCALLVKPAVRSVSREGVGDGRAVVEEWV